jgi:hypothetical protein
VAARRPPTLSAKESLILELLVQGNEMYGLQLVAASRRRLKRGTVYVTLGRRVLSTWIYAAARFMPEPAR